MDIKGTTIQHAADGISDFSEAGFARFGEQAKHLGFDESCMAYHNIDPYLGAPTFNLVKPFDHEWCLPAPLYQQAFRWFRDKHNIVFYIN
ncbi:MAG: hypothetical protein FGM36_13095, partial [Burkholderiaceae bacterium]|nr:hypothetical protein [Burkholderiaceae bacterium]